MTTKSDFDRLAAGRAERLRDMTGKLHAAFRGRETMRATALRLDGENRQLRALAEARGIDVGAALSLGFRWEK